MTGSKIRRGVLPKNQPSILFRERGKKTVDYRKKSFDDFRSMIVEPPSKLDSEDSKTISVCFGSSRGNHLNEVISNMV